MGVLMAVISIADLPDAPEEVSIREPAPITEVSPETDQVTERYGSPAVSAPVRRNVISIADLADSPDKEPAPPEVTQPTPSTAQGLAEGAMGGLMGAGIGASQLALMGLGHLIPGIENPEWLNRASKTLEEEEMKRRSVATRKKDAYGGAGFTNPFSIGEFGGENALEIAAGGAMGVRNALTKLPVSPLRNLGRSAWEGLVSGFASGSAMPTVGGESRTENALKVAAGGALFAPAMHLTTSTGKMLYPYVKGKYQQRFDSNAIRAIDKEAAALMDAPFRKDIEEGLRTVAQRSPSDVKTLKALSNAVKNDHLAVDTVTQMRDGIKIYRHGVRTKGVESLPRTLEESVDATDQAAVNLADWATKLTKAADNVGLRVKFPERAVIDEATGETIKGGLSSLDNVLEKYGRSELQEATAKKYAAKLRQRNAEGGMDLASTVTMMKTLNKEITKLFSGDNSSGSSVEVLGMVASHVRTALNDTMENFNGGPQYAEMRKAMGAVLNLNRRLMKRAEMVANRDANRGMSIFDVIGTEQLIRGATRGRPDEVIAGLSSFAASKVARRLRSKDSAVRKIFRNAYHLNGEKKLLAPDIPQWAKPDTTMTSSGTRGLPAGGDFIGATGVGGTPAPAGPIQGVRTGGLPDGPLSGR